MKFVISLLLIVLTLYVIALLLLYSFQESLIFQANTLEQDYRFQFNTPFEEKTIPREDGAQLHGLHFKAVEPQGLILYFTWKKFPKMSRVQWGKLIYSPK